jgi:putative DNA primase/helicase
MSAADDNKLDEQTEKEDARREQMSFPPFRMTDDGLFVEIDKSKTEIWVCGPFEILGRARDPGGDEWARVIRFDDGDDHSHKVAVKDADLHGDPGALAATLARQGLVIAPRQRRHLIDYLNSLKADKRVTIVTRSGWHTIAKHPVFVLPDESFGAPASETVVLNSGESSPYAARGTPEQWKQGVGRLCSGQRLGVLAVSTALAGPLLHLGNSDGGGIHFRAQSSTGKTSLAKAAASVWGPPSYMRSWRSTANGLEATAALATDTVLVLDELGVIESRELNAATYQLATGAGKGRARRDGSMRMPATWRVMVVSTGEVSIAAKVEEDRNRRARAGQEIRILDIPADAGLSYGAFDSPGSEKNAASLADAIRDAAAESYGTAGPSFIKEVFNNPDEIAQRAARHVELFTKRMAAGVGGQVHRAAQRLGLIAFAGELASEFGIVPWPKGEATKAAEFAFRQWIASRGGTEAAEALAAVSAVRLFIEKHGDSRFEDLGSTEIDRRAPVIHNRAGWRKGEGKDQQWMVMPEVWKSEVCGGLDPGLVAKVLAARDMLMRAPDGLLYVHKISGRSMRLYTVTAGILSGLDAENGVTGVTNVTKGDFQDETPIENDENHSNINEVTSVTSPQNGGQDVNPNAINAVTSVTSVTPSKHINGKMRSCAHCGGDDADVDVLGDASVWVHRGCEEDWLVAHPEDGLTIPSFLRREVAAS